MIQKMILLLTVEKSTPEKVAKIYTELRNITHKEIQNNNLNLNFLEQYIKKIEEGK